MSDTGSGESGFSLIPDTSYLVTHIFVLETEIL